MRADYTRALLEKIRFLFFVLGITLTTHYVLEQLETPNDPMIVDGITKKHLNLENAKLLSEFEQALNELNSSNKQQQNMAVHTQANRDSIASLEYRLAELSHQQSQFISQYNEPDKQQRNAPPPKLTEEQIENQFLAQAVILDEALYYEEEDREWSTEVEMKLSDVLSQEGMGNFNLVNHQCGSTLCRTEIALMDMDEDMDKLDRLMSLVSEGAGRIQVKANSNMAILHYAKDGQSLPN